MNRMLKYIKEGLEKFPEDDGRGYFHSHLPTSYSFINSRKTPNRVRRACINTLLERVSHLIEKKPDKYKNTKVVAAIMFPDMWSSQVIVFFDKGYFDSFFDRNSEYQKWILIEDKEFKKGWNLEIPKNLKVKGYIEKIYDYNEENILELVYEGEVWFIGEL